MTAHPPVVSVVIPTHNRRRLLGRTLATVLAQREVDFEVIVVDDGSSDGTSGDLDGHADERVRWTRHDTARGVSAARNTGAALARGRFVAFCDDDDLWAPTKLRDQVAAIESTPGARWSCGTVVVVDADLQVGRLDPSTASGDVAHLVLGDNQVPGGGSFVLAERALFDEIGGFDEELALLADWDRWIAMSLAAPVAVPRDPLGLYVEHPEGMSRRRDRLEVELQLIEDKHAAARSTYGSDLKWDYWWRWAAEVALRGGDRRSAASLLWKAIRTYRHWSWIPGAAIAVAFPSTIRWRDRWLDRRRRTVSHADVLRMVRAIRSTANTDAAQPVFVSEGALGTKVLGHVASRRAVEHGLREAGVPPVVVEVGGPQRPFELLAARVVPLLGRLDLDLQPTRWHLTMGRRARRALGDRGIDGPLLLDGHTIGFGLLDLIETHPTFVMVDATIRQWAHLAVWRAVRPWTDLSLTASYALERRVFANATVLGYSTWALEGVRREVPDARVREHNPGIDLDTFRPPATRTPGPFRVLFVGGRFAEKGGHDLLAATAHLRPDRLELHIVTGDPVPAAPGLEVHQFSGADPALVELFRQADLFCLPTYADASPFAVIEALGCGTPVLATRVGAIASLVGPAGVIVEPGDVAGLRTAVDTIAGDSDLRRELSGAARARAEDRFSDRRQGKKLAAMLAEAMP